MKHTAMPASKTHVAVAIAEENDPIQTGKAIAKEALAKLGHASPTVALLFVSHPQPDKVLRGVQSVLGNIPLIGTTSAGEYSHAGYVEVGAGLMLIHSEQIQFHPISYSQSWFRRGKKLLGQLIGISPEGLGSIYNHRTLMLFPDDQSMNLDDIVDRAMTETGMLYDIIGGSSPTIPAPPPRLPAVFMNNRTIRSGMVGTEVLSQVPLGVSLANGWQPVSGPYRVTLVDKKHIVKIDGRPTREIYEDFLLDNNLELDTLPPSDLMHYAVGVCGADGDCKVSLAMGFDHRGALRVTTPPPVNTLVNILKTQREAITTAAQRAIQNGLALAQSPPAGVLFIDCMSTGMLLDEAYQQQRQVVQASIRDVPFLGFRSHGVLARLQGQTNGLYECSVGTWIIPE